MVFSVSLWNNLDDSKFDDVELPGFRAQSMLSCWNKDLIAAQPNMTRSGWQVNRSVLVMYRDKHTSMYALCNICS